MHAHDGDAPDPASPICKPQVGALEYPVGTREYLVSTA